MELGSWLPDAPGTINPAKLAVSATPPPTLLALTPPLFPDAFTSSCDSLVKETPSSPLAAANDLYPVKTSRGVRLLSRISSDTDPSPRYSVAREDNSQHIWHAYVNFCGSLQDLKAAGPRGTPASIRKKKLARHNDYFASQMRHRNELQFHPDPDAGPGAHVVADSTSSSIWDAYMLRADVAKNLNRFRRQQITYDKTTKKYTLHVRDGCVGELGQSREVLSSVTLRATTTRFKSLFRSATGRAWESRYSEVAVQWRLNLYEFVELDYVSSRTRHAPEVPDYTWLNLTVVDEVKTMMDLVLHGATGQISKPNEDSTSASRRSSYTAPYQELSRFSLYCGFVSLQKILCLLGSSNGSLRWQTLRRLTSRYRSQIPHCQASTHFTPVISSYHALYLELRLLSSLWPEKQEILDTMDSVCRRYTLDWQIHGVLAQPLYQAYSSLRHGFRRLTDHASIEYRELCRYLHGSNHPVHRMQFQVQDIYRVFVKSGLPNGYKDWIDSSSSSSNNSSLEQRLGTGAAFDDAAARRFLGRHDNSSSSSSSRDAEDRRLLWHGTPLESLLGILDLGLQIRRRGASFTGTMFGNGLYLADSSSKSASFCRHLENTNSASMSGATSGRSHPGGLGFRRPRFTSRAAGGYGEGAEAVLLLCEADVGVNKLESANSIPAGHDVIAATNGRSRCIQGLGQHGPKGWKDVPWGMEAAPATEAGERVKMPDTTLPYDGALPKGGLRFNEYVVYSPSHLIIRYMFRLKISGPGC